MLTFPAYGHWLPGSGRGWIDPGKVLANNNFPTPDEEISAERRRSLIWPARQLTIPQQRLIIQDLHRIADLRKIRLIAATPHTNCVQVLMKHNADEHIPRQVQLIKGALSRCLTVAEGDHPARSTQDRPLIHHKWWTRQYSWLIVQDHDLAMILAVFHRMQDRGDVVYVNPDHQSEQHGEA